MIYIIDLNENSKQTRNRHIYNSGFDKIFTPKTGISVLLHLRKPPAIRKPPLIAEWFLIRGGFLMAQAKGSPLMIRRRRRRIFLRKPPAIRKPPPLIRYRFLIRGGAFLWRRRRRNEPKPKGPPLWNRRRRRRNFLRKPPAIRKPPPLLGTDF